MENDQNREIEIIRVEVPGEVYERKTVKLVEALLKIDEKLFGASGSSQPEDQRGAA